MSKVMLILDKPKKCVDCILLNDRYICVATDCNPIGMEAELCPLKEFPDKMPLTEEDTLNTNWGEDPWFSEGWNECLKEILGDEYETD